MDAELHLQNGVVEAECIAQFNGLQSEIASAIVEYVRAYGNSSSILGETWIAWVLLLAERHWLLQSQQDIARSENLVSAEALYRWWRQRYDDVSHGVRSARALARNILSALADRKLVAVLPSIPICSLQIASAHDYLEEGNARLLSLRNACEAIETAVNELDDIHLFANLKSEIDLKQIRALESVERSLSDLIPLLGQYRSQVRAILVTLLGRLVLQRLFRVSWFSSTNPFREREPEFFERLSAVLLSPASRPSQNEA